MGEYLQYQYWLRDQKQTGSKKKMKWFLRLFTRRYLILKRTNKKSVFYDLNGKKWSAFER